MEIIIDETLENSTRIVSLGALQLKGKQNVVIVAGKKAFVKDAVLAARIESDDLFVNSQTIIIPVITDEDEMQINNQDPDKKSKGFGVVKKELLTDGKAYFGKPTQLNVWLTYLLQEIEEAERQGTKDAMSKGLVLVLKDNGKVIRRGVGLPPWNQIIDELTMKTSSKK